MNDLLNQIDIYEDSEQLANELNVIAQNPLLDATEKYYLKECEVHILGLWKLINELANEAKV